MGYYNDKITNALYILSFQKMYQSELCQVIERLKSVVQADPQYARLLHELYALFIQNEAILYGAEYMVDIDFQAFAAI